MADHDAGAFDSLAFWNLNDPKGLCIGFDTAAFKKCYETYYIYL